MLISHSSHSSESAVTYLFDIPSQPATESLLLFAKQADATLLFPYAKVKSLQLSSVQGELSLVDALDVLLADTRLEYRIVFPVLGASKKQPVQSKPVIYLQFKPVLPATVPQSAKSPLIEEVVTISTRAKQREINRSPSPIDVVALQAYATAAMNDTSDVLRNIVPSFSISDYPISDGATLVRPMNIRGLASDHFLLLVNGKRRHRASIISWQGNVVSDGAQGPDISSIPGNAIETIEILRDGAAAQYGSDAISGVVNMRLINDPEFKQLGVKYGQYNAGEGLYSLAFNTGWRLPNQGYFTLATEFAEAEQTVRGAKRSDILSLIADGYREVPLAGNNWGTPEVENSYKSFVNLSLPIDSNTEIYGYGNTSRKISEGSFFYRHPTRRQGVYGNGETLLVGALNGNTETCPEVPLNGNLPAQRAFAELLANENCFNFQELIPGGFTPRFGAVIRDRSLLLGLREYGEKFTWDISGYYGLHDSDFFIKNTVNASWGPRTPRDFDPGLYRQQEFNLNGDFTYLPSDTIALAFGMERRVESFTIGAGEPASYSDGGLGGQGFSTSANGFPGFSPDIAGEWQRVNYAAYMDAEFEVSDTLLLTAALRGELFDDFGTSKNFKLGANWSHNQTFGLRSTFSTGFKAPTPGQANASNITTQNVDTALVSRGTIPASSAVARSVGARELKPETSQNLSFGAYFDIEYFLLQLDLFYIEVKQRLGLSEPFQLSDAQRERLQQEGVSGAGEFEEFRFFTNNFDTRTTGAELKSRLVDENRWGSSQYEFSMSHHDNRVIRSDLAFSERRKRSINNAVPRTRWRFSFSQQIDSLTLGLRANYFGSFYDDESQGLFYDNTLLDIEAVYQFSASLSVYVGGNNIFSEKGCTTDACSQQSRGDLGQIYSQHSPFGFNGALWYAKVNVSF